MTDKEFDEYILLILESYWKKELSQIEEDIKSDESKESTLQKDSPLRP